MKTRKQCTKCSQQKCLSEFGPDKRRLDSKKSACRACCRKAQNAYRANNTEHVKAIEKKAFERFKKAKPERVREIALKYARANRERLNEYSRQYRKRFPDKIRAATQRYRARKQKASGSHCAKDVKKQLSAQRRKCWWCFETLEENEYHVDHLISLHHNGSNGPENIVIACPKCNLSKNSRLPWEFNGRLL